MCDGVLSFEFFFHLLCVVDQVTGWKKIRLWGAFGSLGKRVPIGICLAVHTVKKRKHKTFLSLKGQRVLPIIHKSLASPYKWHIQYVGPKSHLATWQPKTFDSVQYAFQPWHIENTLSSPMYQLKCQRRVTRPNALLPFHFPFPESQLCDGQRAWSPIKHVTSTHGRKKNLLFAHLFPQS